MPENNWITPQIILTAYAAVVSTFALAWNIANAIVDKMSRMRVVAKLFMRFSMLEETPIRLQVLSLVVVNLSKREKHIKEISVKLPKKVVTFGTKKTDELILSLFRGVKFPLAIGPENEWSYDVFVGEGCKLLFDCVTEGKCKIVIRDTKGKKYKSNPIDIAGLYRVYQENIQVPRELRFL